MIVKTVEQINACDITRRTLVSVPLGQGLTGTNYKAFAQIHQNKCDYGLTPEHLIQSHADVVHNLTDGGVESYCVRLVDVTREYLAKSGAP